MSEPYDDGNPFAPPPLGSLEEDRDDFMVRNIDKIRRCRYWLGAGIVSVIFPFVLTFVLSPLFGAKVSMVHPSTPWDYFFRYLLQLSLIAMIVVPSVAVLETTYWLRTGFITRIFAAFFSAIPCVSVFLLVLLAIFVDYELKILELRIDNLHSINR